MLERFIFFFFQAEDGIRDYKVTGVQTCALPIFGDHRRRDGRQRARRGAGHRAPRHRVDRASMALPVTLRTARLVLRPWRESDRAPFAAMNADPRVMEHFPAVNTRAESDAGFDRITAKMSAQGFGLWAVEVVGGSQF